MGAIETTAERPRSLTGLSPGLLLFVVVAVLLIAYSSSLAGMIHLWNTSDTYAHGWLIVPISLYLLYQRKDVLADVVVRPAWWALVPILACGALWTIADLADVQVVQQLMTVSLLIGVTWLVFGTEWARTAAFPLGFLYLAVPLGDGMTPYLIDMTADFVVHALRLTGIPVYREGTFFVIPSGSWSVVSGCSGMRYLMATVTVGVLFAYLNYRSLWRRIAFVAVAILVAIFANWLRAYGIVMIAHLSGMKLALGVDHYIYGWVFFGVVIFVLMTIGMIWSEAPAPVPVRGSSHAPHPAAGASNAVLGAALIALVATGGWPWLATRASAPVTHPTLEISRDLALQTPGWQPTAPPDLKWRPHFVGGPTVHEQAFRKNGEIVGLYVAWYPQQHQGEELIHAANELVREKYEPWRMLSVDEHATSIPDIAVVRESTLKQRIGDEQILVWESNWAAGRFTPSSLVTKLLEIKSRLGGTGNPAGAVILYTPLAPDENLDAARQRLGLLLGGYAPELDRAFTRASAGGLD